MSLWLRRLLTLLAFAVVLYFFWPLVDEIRAFSDLFRRAHWGWLGIAVLLQVISYTFLAWLNVLVLRPFQGQIGLGKMLVILPPMAFFEIAVPSAGISGLVMRARLLNKEGGYTPEASTFTLILETIYLVGIRVVVGLVGIVYLLRHRQVNDVQLAVLGGVVLFTVLLGVVTVRTGQDQERILHWSLRVLRQWNRLLDRFDRETYPPDRLRARIQTFYAELNRFDRVPRGALWLVALGRVALDAATLWACFLAFRYAVPPGILLTGYGLTLLLSTFSSLPGGLGLADASLAVIYASLGAPEAVAVVAALSYRLIAFWLVRLIGFVNWQVLERQYSKSSTPQQQ